MKRMRKSFAALVALSGSALVLAGCEDTGVSGSASVGVYYDSMMWNDYYRPYPPPPPVRPQPPVRPVPPIAKPPRPVHPIAPRPPIHRPTPRAR